MVLLDYNQFNAIYIFMLQLMQKKFKINTHIKLSVLIVLNGNAAYNNLQVMKNF